MSKRQLFTKRKRQKLITIGFNVWRMPQKRRSPLQEIVIPKKLAPLVKAFSADDQAARMLIIDAAKTISKPESGGFSIDDKEITRDELEGIIALMKGLSPKDTLETIYAAQIVTSHLMGLRLLRQDFAPDQALGLKLLRFSNEAMIQLQKKRAGGISQNINITYNHAGPGPALMQTVIPKDETSCQ